MSNGLVDIHNTCITLFLVFLLQDYLSNVYCLAASKQNSAAPSVPQAIPNLALFKQPNGPCNKE